MDKTLFFFIVVGIISANLLMDFLERVDTDSDSGKTSYGKKANGEAYIGQNSIGDNILLLEDLPLKKQILIWNDSQIKRELISSFPNFSIMKEYADQHIKGTSFKIKVIKEIDSIEDVYISGSMSQEEALNKLKFKNNTKK